MRRIVILALLCALAFGILASWLGPKMIGYWYAPPVASGIAGALNCTDAVMWAMNRLVWTQIIGSAAGALVGLVIGVLLGRGKGASPNAPTSAAPGTPAAK